MAMSVLHISGHPKAASFPSLTSTKQLATMLPANYPIAKRQGPPAKARGAPPATTRDPLSTAERLKVEEWTINDLEQRIDALYAAHAKLKKLHTKLSGTAAEQPVDDKAYDEVLVKFYAAQAMAEQNEREVAALEKRLHAIESAAHHRQEQHPRPLNQARMRNFNDARVRDFKRFPIPEAPTPIRVQANRLDEDIPRRAPVDKAEDVA
ncbi:hypothetical protein PENSPDRAFT_648704 [Peniophora sp. CONT]|nr:hypothetical protein PENSPDRAFT_648704 [Peniophora sp. CONT]